jgi:hypothetical protein
LGEVQDIFVVFRRRKKLGLCHCNFLLDSFTLNTCVMKKYLIFLAAFVLATGFNLFAGNGNMIVKIEKGEQVKTIDLRIANLQGLRTNIVLEDMNGAVWFDEYAWGESGYAKKLNLNGMPNGDYVLYVKNSDDFHAQAFTVGTADIAFFKEQMEAKRGNVYAHLVAFDLGDRGSLITHFNAVGEQTLSVRLANFQKRPAIIELMGLKGGVQLRENAIGENGYAKRWNLSGLGNGEYVTYVRTLDTTVALFFRLNENHIELLQLQRTERPMIGDTPAMEIISAR